MSKENERKLLKALDKAATMSITETDPNKVLVKVAQEFKLTHPELCRVTEAYNKAKSVAFLKKASSEDRANDFPLADMTKISESIYGVEKTAEEKTFPVRNYADMYNSTLFEKTAAETKTESTPRPAVPRSRASVWKQASEYYESQSAVKSILDNKRRNFKVQRDYTLKKVASICEHMKKDELTKVARLLVNAYGIEKGAEYIKEINQNVKCNKLPENLQKTAHAAMFPIGEVYLGLSDIHSLGLQLDRSRKDFEWFQKNAEDVEPGPLVKQVGDLSKLLVIEPKTPEAVDIHTAMPSKWDPHLKNLEAKKMIYDLYRFDPVVQSYPLSDVGDAYNEIVGTTPALADNKAWMRASLRRMLTQGKAVDPFEIKDMLASAGSRAQAAKEYAALVGHLKPEAPKGPKPEKESK